MSKNLARRAFLKNAAALAAAPYVIPASALGKDGAAAPSERIVMGAIGVGGRGSGDLGTALHEQDVQVVAVCDVRKPTRERAKGAVDQRYGNKDCGLYADFRELLARNDIDAVLMAPGDRWHTPMSVLAMRSGKDVYSEKPGTMTIAEGQALVRTAKQYARVFQSGIQRRSEANFIVANELARTGRLGKVHTVYAHTLPFRMLTTWLPAEPEPPKEEFNWDMWLGPAPWRPYNHGYLGGCGAFLDYYDFGTGVAGWCSHTVCQCQGAIDCDLTSPSEYEYPKNESSEGFAARYANGVKLVLAVGNFGSLGVWRGSCGVRYEGSEGWVSIADGYSVPDVSAPSLLSDSRKLVRDYLERNQRPLGHMRDFLNCIRTRRLTVSNPEVAHRSMSTCHVINISMLLKRNLKWDPAKEEFVGDADANRMRSRALREPWRI
jgi:hypothetical protein